jgi:DinB family protein
MTDPGDTARTRTVDYLRTRAAGLDAPRIRARVRSAGAELEAALAGLGETDARRPTRPDEWTVAQVVDHVAQSTVRAAEELRHLLAGRRPPGPPIYEGLLSGAAHRVPWFELVEGLREASAALDALLEEAARRSLSDVGAATVPTILTTGTPDGRGADPFTAELTWKEYALVQRLHFLDHREQIRRLRAALGVPA